MAETGKPAGQQDADNRPADMPPEEGHSSAIWEGLQQYAHFPDWMVAARDARRLARALNAVVPEFSTGRGQGPWQLKDLDIGHFRYKDGAWSALFALTARRPGATEDTLLELQGKIFPPGKFANQSPRVEGNLSAEDWRAVLPEIDMELQAREPDTMLASLDFLTDPEKSRAYLEGMLQAHFRGIKIKNSAPNVVRYNRGSRCTVVYHLEYADEQKKGWLRDAVPDLVVAKTYRGDKGKNAFESMSALWDSSLGTSDIVKIAEPLAYQPENRVLIQGPIREEQTLEELLIDTVKTRSPELVDAFSRSMRLTAQGLAALHTSGVRLGGVWGWKDQMEEVEREVNKLAIVLPGLLPAAAPLLERLNRLAAQTPPDPLVPSHGTFRPPQVLLYKEEIGFIDFDSFRQSEPADDLALFLGEMFNMALTPQEKEDRKVAMPLDKENQQARFDFLMTAHDQFLEEYQKNLRDAKHPEVTYQRVILWEALNMFMFVLHAWTKIKLGDLESMVDLLQRFLIATRIVGTRDSGTP